MNVYGHFSNATNILMFNRGVDAPTSIINTDDGGHILVTAHLEEGLRQLRFVHT
jgi:hypothetical protein